MAVEQTLAIIKPDGYLKEAVHAEVIRRYVEAGLTVKRIVPYRFDLGTAAQFYRDHKGRHYYEGLILAMSSGFCSLVVLEGEDAIGVVRALNGATRNPQPGTIRHDIKSADGPFNVVHGSDSPEAVLREMAIVFPTTH